MIHKRTAYRRFVARKAKRKRLQQSKNEKWWQQKPNKTWCGCFYCNPPDKRDQILRKIHELEKELYK